MRTAHILTGVIFLAACSADLPHEAAFDPGAPLEKQAKASLSGTIQLDGESDFSQVTLDLQNEARTYNVDTAADGGVSLTGIVPGEYTLSLRTRYFQAVTETLTVELGETVKLGTRILSPLRGRVLGLATSERMQGANLVVGGGVSLSLQKTSSIRVAVASAPAFRTAAAAATTGPTLRMVSGANGDYEFGGVPAGGYRLYASTPETGERVVGNVTVTGEGDITVDPIVLRPLTGYFEILGTANGVPSKTHTSVAAVNLQLHQSNATQVKVAVSTNGTTTGCNLAAATPEALPANTLRPLSFTSEGKKLVCVSYVDADGKETEPIYGSIIWDATPPTLASIQINGGSAVVSTALVTLNLSAVDVLSGVSVYKVDAVNTFPLASAKPFQSTDVYSLGMGDGPKTVWVTYGDQAGNFSSPVSVTVVLDTTAPLVGGAAGLTKLDGTPLSTGGTLNENRVVLTSSVSDASTLQMQVTTNGSYTGVSWVPYEPNKVFDLPTGSPSILARVRDGAGLVTDLLSAFSLTVDTAAPALMFNRTSASPANSLTVALTLSAGETSEAQVSESPAFDGADWFPTAATSVVLTAGDGVRTIYARARDVAGNISAIKTVTVQIDQTPPQLADFSMNGGAAFTNNATVNLSFTGIEILEYRVSENTCAGTYGTHSGNATFNLSGQGPRIVAVQFRDAVGNPSACLTKTITLDTAPPAVSSFVINGGASYAMAREVTAAVIGGDAAEMILSESASFAGASWMPVTAETAFLLSGVEGMKTVYARFRDAAGNTLDLNDSIELDSVGPGNATLTIQGKFAGAVSTSTVSVTLSATGGPVDAEIAYDPGFVTSLGSFAPTGTHNVLLPAGDGSKNLYVRFFDAAGNSSALAGDSAILDTTPPTASFTIANASPTQTNPLTLNYTAAGATNFRTVEDTACGGAFEPVGGGTKSLSVSAFEGIKEVRMQFFDAVGNASACLLQSVSYDPNPPVVGVFQMNYGQAATSSNVVTISFVGVSGATRVVLSEDAGFAGADWSNFAATKTLVLSPGNGVKTVYAKVADDAGHIVALPQQSITLDTTPPTNPSIYAAFEVTTQTSVLLTLSAGLVAEMILSQDDPAFTSSSWEPYTGSKVFALSGADGTKTIYAKFRKSTLVETAVVSDTVILDRAAPTFPSVRINNGLTVVTSNIVTLALSAVDGASGLATYKVNTVNDFSAVSPKSFQATDVFSFGLGDGLKTVWVSIGDRAGLYSIPVSATVLLDETAPAVGSVALTKMDGTPLLMGDTVAENRVLLTSTVTDLSNLEMQVTTNGSFVGVAWVPYEPGKVIDLTTGTPSISVRVRDGAGLITDVMTAFGLTVDTTAPALSFIRSSGSPTNDLTVNVTLSASETSEAQVSEDPAFSGAAWFPTANTSLVLTPGDGLRTIFARARDAAGNVSVIKQISVEIDATPPSSASLIVNAGAMYTKVPGVTLAIGGLGATEMQVSGNSTFAGAGWAPFSTSYAHSITGGEGQAYLYLRLRDSAGNYSGSVSAAIVLDSLAPTGASIVIAEQPKTRQAWVSLTLSASGATELMLADDASFGGRAWQPVTAATQWTLPPGDGAKRIHVKYRDAAGNESTPASATTILDTAAPVASSLMLNGGAAVTSSTVVAYAIAATDALSEPLQMQVSGEPGFGGAVWNAYAATGTQTITPGDGVRSLYVRFRDAVGNVSLAASGSFILDQTGPQLAAFIANEGRVFAGASVFVDFQVGNWAAGDMVQVATAADFSGASDYPSNAGVNRAGYTLAAPDGAKTVYARAKDMLGNFGPAWSTAITRDTAPPTVTGPKAIVLEGDANFTTTRFVNLDLNVADATEMLLWNSGQLLYATWEPFSASTVWALPFGDGVHTVQARFRDAARNVIQPFSDMITLDTGAPTSPSIVINGGAGYVTTTTVALTLSAVGVDGMQLSGDGVFDTEPLIAYAINDSWTFPASEGLKTVYARFCDTAGNCSQVVSAQVVLDQTLPTASLSVNQGALRTASSTVTLNLSASDNVSGLQGIKLADSLAALATTNVVTFEATKIWTLAAPTGAGVESAKEVWLQVVDRAGLGSIPVSDGIVFDTLPPTGGITLAAAVTRDTLVGVDLSYSSDATHFKLSAGNACAGGNWIEASTQSVFTLPGIDGVHDVSVRFRDGVMNESTCYAASVVLDRVGPLPTVFTLTGSGSPQAGYSDSADVAVGFGTPEGCVRAEFAEDAGFFLILQAEAGCAGAAPYTFVNPADGIRSLYLRFVDALGNMGPVTGQTIAIDSSGPDIGTSGAFTIVEGAFVRTTGVTLQMQAVGATRVRIAQDTVCSGGLETYSPSRPLTLSGGDGAKTLSVRFEDEAGNATSCYSRQVTLDTGLPNFMATVTGTENVAGRTARQVVTLTLSGVSADAVEMMFSDFAGFSGSAWIPLQTVVQRILQPGDGMKTIYVKIRDLAGNESAVLQPQIELDQSPPESPVVAVMDVTGDGFAMSATDVEVQWNSPSDPNLAGYRLERYVRGLDVSFMLVGDFLPGVNTFVDDVTESVGHSHEYRIRAYDDLGNQSNWSVPDEALPFDPVDAAFWSREIGDQFRFDFRVNPGTFSLSGSYAYEDPAGVTFTETLVNNRTYFERPVGWDRYNERLILRTANAVNSLVYESTIPLGIQLQTRVDTAGVVGFFTSVVLDKAEKDHISYWDSTNGDLKYATNASGAWVVSTVDTAGNVGRYSSIALDAAGKIHIAYHYQTGGDLRYATNASGAWVVIAVDTTGNVGESTSIALDALGKVHISYYDLTNLDLKYATNASGSWVATAVDSAGDVGRYTSLALDNAGKAHISYYDVTNTDLKYVTNASGSWVATAVDTAGDVGYTTSIELDASNKAHISYYDGTNLDLKYATNASGSWVLTAVDTAGSVGGNAALALDSSGKVHISYSDFTVVGLKYATNASGAWVAFSVDLSASSGFTSIAVDSTSKAHISYYDSSNGDLKFAVQASGSQVAPKIVDAPGNVGRYTSLDLDNLGKAHISYYDVTKADLKYATNTSGSWVTTSVDSTGDVGRYSSLAVDDLGKIHISYIDTTNTDLKYATNASGAWVIASVDTIGNVGLYSSLAIDKLGKVHIAYFDNSNFALKYATNASGSWVLASITSGSIASVSLALDDSGKAHISYLAGATLKYMTNVSGSWVTSSIASSILIMAATSLGLDSLGKAHIGYYDSTNYDLKIASNESGSWVSTAIDTAGDVGEHASLAVDDRDKIHVAYFRNTNGDLKYATNPSSAWITNTVDTAGTVGWYSSLAVDDFGRAHISYYDVTSGDLKYVTSFNGAVSASTIQRVSAF